ncbi:molybdate ABC transporter substrate-binding protein [Mycobacterium sp. 3519A]|uniref:molybdate ABC transporter substrate-binding protein n=1 Tax=Mycobacterium sp. 3519A TaxID=2057184 RepID=UPI000C7D1D03|nr:molybdate ABC transporter substrate-binding protein [Mycobacterium sp. 3519A]
MRARFKQTVAAGILFPVVASGCSSQARPTTSITVFASSAMIKSLTTIGKQFEAENPGTAVEFIFSGSSDLSAELSNGNGADVFVSGDHDNMTTVANAGLIAAPPVPIAANSLVIATAPGNRGQIASFADLGRPGVRVAVCGVPSACAAATRQLEDRARVPLHPQYNDMTDIDVLRDVTTGKADAGLVFQTDAMNAGDKVSWFAFPESADAQVTSWIAPVKDSDQATLANKFIQDVTGPAGRKVLADAGFTEPTEKFEG